MVVIGTGAAVGVVPAPVEVPATPEAAVALTYCAYCAEYGLYVDTPALGVVADEDGVGLVYIVLVDVE